MTNERAFTQQLLQLAGSYGIATPIVFMFVDPQTTQPRVLETKDALKAFRALLSERTGLVDASVVASLRARIAELEAAGPVEDESVTGWTG